MSKPEPYMVGTLPLTPQWHHEALRLKKEQHPRIYYRGFEHRAISEGELLFPSWRIVRDRCKGLKIADIMGAKKADWFGEWGRFGGVDLSGTTRPGNAIVTLAGKKNFDAKKNHELRHSIVLLDAIFGAWTQPVLVQQLSALYRWWQWNILFVETNGIQEEMLHWADVYEADWTSVVEGFCTTAKKWDQLVGLPGIEVELARGLWTIPYGEWETHSVTCECGWCTLDRQMSTFPATATFDGVMGLYFAWEAFRKGRSELDFLNINYRAV